MKTAISLPDDLFDAAEREAKRRGVSRSKLVQTALEELIRTGRSEDITDALNRSYLANPEPSDALLSELSVQTMKRSEWADEEGRDLVGKRRTAKGIRARIPATRRHHLGK